MIEFDRLWDDIITYDLHSRCKYHELRTYFPEANGCGAKGGKKFPDSFLFVSIIAACIIHDIEWFLAESYRDLLDANERFDNNLKRITDQKSMNSFMRWARRQMISYYISGVELVGIDEYAIKKGIPIVK